MLNFPNCPADYAPPPLTRHVCYTVLASALFIMVWKVAQTQLLVSLTNYHTLKTSANLLPSFPFNKLMMLPAAPHEVAFIFLIKHPPLSPPPHYLLPARLGFCLSGSAAGPPGAKSGN